MQIDSDILIIGTGISGLILRSVIALQEKSN